MAALALSFTHHCCTWHGPAGRLMKTQICWLSCKQGQESCVSPAHMQPALYSSEFTPVWQTQAKSYLPTDLRKGTWWTFVANCAGYLVFSWAVGWRVLVFQGSGGQFAHGRHETGSDSSASLLTCAPGLPFPSALGIFNLTKLATNVLQNYQI